MNGTLILSIVAAITGLLALLLPFITNWRAKKNDDKRIKIEERDFIAKDRLAEITRLNRRIDEQDKKIEDFQKTVEGLHKDNQAQREEVSNTKYFMRQIGRIFVGYIDRVEEAWKFGHPMPELTPIERTLLDRALEDSIPIPQNKGRN